MDLTSCPECGAPAEIIERHVLSSTDGPLEACKIRCVQRHWFLLRTGALAEARPPAPAPAPTTTEGAAR